MPRIISPEELREWKDRLVESETHIIVEGKNDKKALLEIGVSEDRIVVLRKPLFEHVEDIAKEHEKIIILTDLDPEGRKLFSSLRHDLQRHGVKVDTYFREFLFGTGVSHIEGLSTYLRNIDH